MIFKSKTFILLGIFILSLFLITGCDSGSSADTVYYYNGSIGMGDFISVELNLSQNQLKYENRITGDKGSSDFTKLSNGMYSMGDDLFVTLEDQVLLATDVDGKEGEMLITTLKEIDSAYGDEIIGKYNIITSLEGARGTVEIKANNKVDITFADSNLDDLSDLDYSYNESFKAIEIVEEGADGSFRHYGVFLEGGIGVFDSYWKETPEASWQGDGMSVLVREDSSIDLEDFAGSYTYIDVDADYGSFEIEYVDESSLNLVVPNEGSILLENIDLDKGLASFSASIAEDQPEDWSMMLLPGEVIVLGSETPHTFGGDAGGLLIGIRN